MSTKPPTEFRVFVSSTFRDLQEEREHLVNKIFPEIRALARERGVTFAEVDLRQTVAEEDADNGRAVHESLEEIDRSRPYFIGITGDHYGFVPDKNHIRADKDLVERFPWIEEAVAEGASLTDLEFRYGALNAPTLETGAPRAIFYFRQRLGNRDSAAIDRMKLTALERRVRAGGFRVCGYQSAESLGELIREELLDILDKDFGVRNSIAASGTE